MKKAQPTDESPQMEEQAASNGESAAGHAQQEVSADGNGDEAGEPLAQDDPQEHDEVETVAEAQQQEEPIAQEDEVQEDEAQEADAEEDGELQAVAQDQSEAGAQEEPAAEAQGEYEPGQADPAADGDDDQPMLPHVLPNPIERRALLEAIVYVAEEPVNPEQIAEVLAIPVGVVQEDLEQLCEEMRLTSRGIEIRKVAGGYKMFTKAEHHDAIRGFVKTLRPKLRLSLPALETLAVVAYKQPVTVPEIQAVRGVNAGGVIHTLLNHKLITTAGRKKVIGRPMQYKTTKDFLVQFGLNDLSELPNLKELEELSRAALGEGEEPEGTVANGSEPGAVTEDANGVPAANGPGEESGESTLAGVESSIQAEDAAQAEGEEAPAELDEAVVEGDEAPVEETATEQNQQDVSEEDVDDPLNSPVAALGAAVGGAGFPPSRPDDDSEEDPD